MKSIVLRQPGEFRAEAMPEPGSPGAGEVLVQVRRIGICGTDLHAFRGRQPFFSYPRILGHELGVEVLAVGANVTSLRVGDRCALEPYLECARCVACRRGKTNCCTSLCVLGVHADGGMRERLLVPSVKLHRSDVLTLDQLALVETLGIGAHAVARGAPEVGESVLVVGVGPIGLAVVQFAIEAQARVTVLDSNPRRLEFCRRQFGVEQTLDGSRPVPAALEELLGGDLPTLVFDATGNPQAMAASFQLVAHGGKLVFVGLFQGDVTFHDPDFHRRELTLLASRNSTRRDFQRILGLMESGRIDTTPWITHRCEFEAMIEQFPRWLEPESNVVKVMVELPAP